MGRDSPRDDPMLRVARASAQLFAWFERHGGPAGDAVHRASAHLLCHEATDDHAHASAARAVLQGLLAGELPVTLSGRATLGAVCLQANEVLGDRVFLEAAHSLCDAIAQGPLQEHDEALCFSALPGRMVAVHHANLQAAALMARMGLRVADGGFIELGRRACAFSLAHQRPDGSWLHGEHRPLRWVDRFHAGVRVASLLELSQVQVHPAVHAALARALRHLVSLHFDAVGRPFAALRDDEPLECDLLAAAEAMGALARVAGADATPDGRAATAAAQMADWASQHLHPWSLWRDPPSVHGPGRLLDALVQVQMLGARAWGHPGVTGAWQGRRAPSEPAVAWAGADVPLVSQSAGRWH